MRNQRENQRNEQQLKEVKEAFVRWRKNRRSYRELIPKKLMDQAAKLCSIYKTGRIALELHLEFNNLKRYYKEYNRHRTTNLQQTDFIEMDLAKPMGQTSKAGTMQNCRITLDTGDGRKIDINLENPTADILMEALKAIL